MRNEAAYRRRDPPAGSRRDNRAATVEADDLHRPAAEEIFECGGSDPGPVLESNAAFTTRPVRLAQIDEDADR